MALSLILRNTAKLRGISSPPFHSFRRTQSFSQLLNNRNQFPLVAKTKMNLVNVINQTKRNMSADHSKLWPIEKAVSVLLIGIAPATFICPNPIFDNLFALTTVIHFHWGLEAVVVDYIRPAILGPVLPKLALILLYVVSATTLGSLLYYNHNSEGIGKTFQKLWAIQE
ncbi:succinate dehydrogenase [ubiquinone] cytochrome b small subunit, mitochondrial [Cylas formicarius]|uniref:succinate dehydrogenase [ubiquinone] cytochrome b small subunit, mitochondrial n=1 Tax=Cylas formicarius TaxID=197179 RepID=UPI0029585425|nr:succinate dehydrogenase [ubiquinone] cytochrome b small subunit, mitochondrial [Cylas formicarius]